MQSCQEIESRVDRGGVFLFLPLLRKSPWQPRFFFSVMLYRAGYRIDVNERSEKKTWSIFAY
jgi:hypothetical protein